MDQGRTTPETAQRAWLTFETPLRTPGMAAIGTRYPWKCCARMGNSSIKGRMMPCRYPTLIKQAAWIFSFHFGYSIISAYGI